MPRAFVVSTAQLPDWPLVAVETGLLLCSLALGLSTLPPREARAMPVLPLLTACSPPGWRLRGYRPAILVAAVDGAAFTPYHGICLTGSQMAVPVGCLAPRVSLRSGLGRVGGLADRRSVCHLTQLTGMAIGALLALALVGITVFFMYRRVNQFREYIASDCALGGRGESGDLPCVSSSGEQPSGPWWLLWDTGRGQAHRICGT